MGAPGNVAPPSIMSSMCQFHPRCPVKQHRPGTVCPYSNARSYGAGRGGSVGSPTVPRTRPSGPAGPRRYRRVAASSCVSTSDLLIVILVAAATDRYYEDTGWFGVLLAVLAVVVPFALAGWLTWTCTAWNGSKEGRCEKPRRWWRRCELLNHARAQQFVTAPEVAAIFSLIVGFVNAAIVLGLVF